MWSNCFNRGFTVSLRALQPTVLVFLLLLIDVNGTLHDKEDANMKKIRLQAKPWFVRNISYGGVNLPISPVSLVIWFLSAYYVYNSWSGKPVYVVASHILLSDPSEETKKRMEGWKQKIGSDLALFCKYAADLSVCQSKSKGGSLGRFSPNQMVPPFDRVCFDPQSPLHTTLGPVQTQHGWHLIFIQDRQLPN